MNVTRALVGGILAELLVIVLIAPVALLAGLDTLDDPANLPPSVAYGIVIASFIAPAAVTQWVSRRVTSRFVLHGLLVGVTAFVVYMTPMALSGETQPPIYWAAHAMKILGGLTGGVIAARRYRRRDTVVAT